MIRNLIFYSCLIVMSFSGYTQDLLKSRHSSYYTYIYQITDSEARLINNPRKWQVDSSFFHSLVKSHPSDSVFDEVLPQGHYLSVFAEGAKLKIDYFSIQHFDVEIFNNSRDLSVKVFSTSGDVIKNARVRVGLKHLHFDQKTSLYKDRKSNRKGLLEVIVDGYTAYYHLDRDRKNSRVRRITRKTLYGTPLKYPAIIVRRTVRTIYRAPKDIVNSFRWGYPQGFVQNIVRKSENLFYGTLCLFDREYCNWNGDDWRFRQKYTGYLTFSKPKYMPGDTVKFKAYILKKKRNKPLKKSVYPELYVPGKSIDFGELKPYAPGGYEYEFVVGDTIDLKPDKHYNLYLYNKWNKQYLSAGFQYEDYELGKISLDVSANVGDQFRGDSVIVKIEGKDDNGLNLLDARLEITVTADQVLKVFGNETFVPDILYENEMDLLPSEPTELVLSDTLFPSANMSYTVNVRLLTSDNQSKTQSINLDFYENYHLLDYELIGDSLSFKYLENGKVVPKSAAVIGLDAFGYEVERQQVDLPVKVALNPFFHTYRVQDEDEILTEFELADEEAQLSFSANRASDSLFVNAFNPRNIPFVYYLFKTNNLLKRGHGTSLVIRDKANGKGNYYLAVQYLWGGRVIDNNYEIPLRDAVLNIELQMPPVIYPGQEVEASLKVTDYKGKPAKEVDILAHGLTSKFKSSPTSLPDLTKQRKQRELINTFNLSQKPFYQQERKLDYDKWNPLMVLDSIEYYKFLYPDSPYRFEYVSSDSITQFAPFIVKEGIIQPVNVVYVDEQVVYLGWAKNEPYSFSITPGFHRIRVRTDRFEYYIDELFFEKGKKLIFCIDHDHLPKDVRRYDRGLKFTNSEVFNLERYTIYFRHTFGENLAYIQQGERFFKIPPVQVNGVIGPLSESDFKLSIFNGYETRMKYEPKFEYEFAKGLVKMRRPENMRFMPEITSNMVNGSFYDQVNTLSSLKDDWENIIRNRRLQSRKYYNPSSTSHDEGKLIINSEADIETAQILNSLLFKLDDVSFLQVYPGYRSVYHGLKEGKYRLIFLMDNESYFLQDSIQVQMNGENYHNLDAKRENRQDSFAIEINQMMDRYFEQNAKRKIGGNEREQIYRSYQRSFQYFGEGEVISGVVTDDTGEPLPGVTVLVKGTTYGTITDINGYYSIKVPYDHQELVFSFVGFSPIEIHASNLSGAISMEADVEQLQEVVVVGYSVQSKRSLTSSVVTISDVTFSEVAELEVLSNALQGKVAGVSINSNSGIQIRGASTISGEQAPLIVIDGVIYSGKLEDLSPDLIKNVEVLKSESLTALYGSRAANGVLMITTKGSVKNDLLKGMGSDEVTADLLQEMNNASAIRNNFSDEAFWKPTIRTDKQGEAHFKIKFPDDITSWDTYVYAMTGNQSGQAQKTIKSFKPLTAQIAAPRFIIENDSVLAIGKSLNYTYDTVQVTTSFELDGELVQTKDVRFASAHIDTLLLQSSGQDSIDLKYFLEREDGYFDGELRSIPVYPVGVEKNVGEFAALKGDTTAQWVFSDSLGPVQFYAESRSLDLLKDKIDYLINYPYSCNEQLASKLKGLVISLQLDEDLEIQKARKATIKRVVKKLEKNQNEEGFWGWWNQSMTESWISVHVLEALIMAREAGISVKIDETKIIDEAVWLLTSQKPVNRQTDALYMAALLQAGIAYDQFFGQLDTARHTLASKLILSKTSQLLRKPSSNQWLLDSLHTDKIGRYYLDKQQNIEWCFYSDRSVEWTAHALTVLGNDSTVSEKIKTGLEDYLLYKLNGTRFFNTYTLSNSIWALSTVLSSGEQKDSRLEITGVMDSLVTSFPVSLELNPGTIDLKYEGLMPAYVTAYQTYWEKSPSKDSSDFEVNTYFKSGNLKMKAGEVEILIANVKVDRDVEFVMIEIPIPAGCSYDNKRQFPGEVHREYYRNKVNIFCRRLKEGSHEFSVSLLPRYSGQYTLNPAKAELMYFPVIYGHEGVKRVNVE